MKQKLLADIELDVQELKCLMKSFAQEPNSTLTELLKRNILQMQGRLEQLLQELDSDRETPLASIVVTEKTGKSCVPAIEDTDVEENVSITKNSLVEEPPVAVKETVKETEMALTEEVIVTEMIDEELPKTEKPHKVEENNIETEPPGEEELPMQGSFVAEGGLVHEGVEERTQVTVEGQGNTSILKDEMKTSVLGESIKISKGLRASISLNDSFRFSRELFGGDTSLMNRVIEQMSVMSSYKAAMAFLFSKVDINEGNEAHNDFLELVKKYFNQSA